MQLLLLLLLMMMPLLLPPLLLGSGVCAGAVSGGVEPGEAVAGDEHRVAGALALQR